MRNLVLALTLAAVAPLLAQPSSSYRITHTYTLGGDGSWDYIVPDPPNHRLFIGRQTRVMVVDEDNGALLGEVTGIKGAHGDRGGGRHGTWIRHVGQRPVCGDVRSEDLQGARPESPQPKTPTRSSTTAHRTESSRSTATRIRRR